MNKITRRDLIIICLSIALIAGALLTLSSKNNDEHLLTSSDNWGLAFPKEGGTPTGNASREYLLQYNCFYMGASAATDKSIYLTFDAGYENGYTEKILDVLKEKKVPAAFFLVGSYITDNPELVRRMEKEGHLVGNHTMTHPDMSAIDNKESFKEELTKLETVYKDITGKDMKKYYRPPQGKYSEINLKMANEMGYKTVFWSLAYVDWLVNEQPAPEDAINLLNKRIHPGAIVLLHSTSKTNSLILATLIDGWKKEGYTFKSLENIT